MPSVVSFICRVDRMGDIPASEETPVESPVEAAVEEPGAERVDCMGVVRTDWLSQKPQDRRTKRNSLCVISFCERGKKGRVVPSLN